MTAEKNIRDRFAEARRQTPKAKREAEKHNEFLHGVRLGMELGRSSPRPFVAMFISGVFVYILGSVWATLGGGLIGALFAGGVGMVTVGSIANYVWLFISPAVFAGLESSDQGVTDTRVFSSYLGATLVFCFLLGVARSSVLQLEWTINAIVVVETVVIGTLCYVGGFFLFGRQPQPEEQKHSPGD